MPDPPVLLILDLAGTFAFALNGALTAVRSAHLDIVGVISLGVITAVGGGIVRDVLLGVLPPATFVDWRNLAVAISALTHRNRRALGARDQQRLALTVVSWRARRGRATTSLL